MTSTATALPMILSDSSVMIAADNNKIKRKRNVLLDEESERLLQQQEREEFHKVIEEQYSHVNIKKLGTLPECAGVRDMHLINDGSWGYWMSVMLQYQTLRSYTHYSTDEDNQQKQLEWQKTMRFQLMQKKRAIKREKRKVLKLQKQLNPRNKNRVNNTKETKRSRCSNEKESQSSKRTKFDEEEEYSYSSDTDSYYSDEPEDSIETSKDSAKTCCQQSLQIDPLSHHNFVGNSEIEPSFLDFSFGTPMDFILNSPFPMSTPSRSHSFDSKVFS